jgi:hypothetical protein
MNRLNLTKPVALSRFKEMLKFAKQNSKGYKFFDDFQALEMGLLISALYFWIRFFS